MQPVIHRACITGTYGCGWCVQFTMNPADHCSIMEDITRTETAIKDTYERLRYLEKKLREEALSGGERTAIIQKELKEARKLLKTHEEQLAHLRTHNRKTFVFVAAMMFITFAVYVFYVLVTGGDF